jgi:hypothetical protein
MDFSLLFRLGLALIIPLLTGHAVISALFRRGPDRPGPFFILAMAYAMGCGLISLWFLFLGVAGLPFNNVYLVSLPPLLTGFLLRTLTPPLISPLKEDVRGPKTNWRRRAISATLILFIGTRFLLIWLDTLSKPLITWDALATWGLNAKVFFYEGSLFSLNIPHGSYPLLVPFSQTWIALHLGAWDDYLIKVFFPGIFLSYFIIQYHYLKKETGHFWALAGSCLLLSSNYYVFHVSAAYADIVISCYFCASILFLLSWRRNRHFSWLILAGFFSGFGAFTKLEGSAYLIIHSVILFDLLCRERNLRLKDKIYGFLAFAVPACSIAGSFHVYKMIVRAAKHPNELLVFSLDSLPEKSADFFQHFFEQLVYVENWNICWWIVPAYLLLFPDRIREDPRLRSILTTLALFGLFYLGAANLTGSYVYLGGENTAFVLPRILIHVFPLAPLFIALANGPKVKT